MRTAGRPRCCNSAKAARRCGEGDKNPAAAGFDDRTPRARRPLVCVRRDGAITRGIVEPFYGTGCHTLAPSTLLWPGSMPRRLAAKSTNGHNEFLQESVPHSVYSQFWPHTPGFFEPVKRARRVRQCLEKAVAGIKHIGIPVLYRRWQTRNAKATYWSPKRRG